MKLSAIKNFLLDLLFPRACFACQKEGSNFCADCFKKISFKAPQCFICGNRSLDGKICDYCRTKTLLSRFFAIGDYDDPILREAIHFLKYQKITSFALPLSDLAANYWKMFMASLNRKPDLLIPLPLHPKRERERGFNQSFLIAQLLAQHAAIPLAQDVLLRTKNTRLQVGIEDTAARKENMKDAFAVARSANIKGKTILLFDDVATTGATLSEAAHALKEAGARSVWGFVLAR